jgi:CheY-like chemotaxis protein
MPDGGVFTIEVSGRFFDRELIDRQGYGTPGHYGQIDFSDSGTGMDAETREKIFEPFFTTKTKDKGTGLGMSIVHGIVKQHGGFINIDSQPGLGSTFKVLLPSRQDETPPATDKLSPPAKEISKSGRNEMILLAEDEQSVRQLLAAILEDAGYKIIQAATGNEAVAEYAAAPRKFDLIILDVMMPNKSGKEVLDHVRQLEPEARILFISGYPADIIHRTGITGNLDFLSKPIMPTVLLSKVRQILDR